MELYEPHDDPMQAFEAGRVLGLDFEASAARCPFGHDDMSLRDDWFDGFSAGRAEAYGGPRRLGRLDRSSMSWM